MTRPPTDRCPLCGGAEHDRYRACDNPACELPVKNWPRVAELVAESDADCDECKTWVSALYRFIDAAGPRKGMSIPEEFEHAMARLAELVAVEKSARGGMIDGRWCTAEDIQKVVEHELQKRYPELVANSKRWEWVKAHSDTLFHAQRHSTWEFETAMHSHGDVTEDVDWHLSRGKKQ